MKFKRTYNSVIDESFAYKDIPSAVALMKSYLERKTGLKLYQMGGEGNIDEFINDNGKGEGVRFFIDNTTNAVRFNFTGEGKVVSIDVWGDDESEAPEVHVDTSNIMSITKALPVLAGIILHPKVGEYDVIVNDAPSHHNDKLFQKKDVTAAESKIFEMAEVTIGKNTYKSKGEAIVALIDKGMTNAEEIASIVGSSKQVVYGLAKAAGKTVSLKVSKGLPEIDASGEIKPAEQKLEQQEFADPKVVFKDLEDLVKMVANGVSNALFVCGMAGIGKTHVVTETLNKAGLKEDDTYVKFTGASSARGLYEMMFLNHDKVIVCDDMDSVFKDQGAVNILKGSLDTKKVRRISWVTANQFSPDDPNDIDSIITQAQELEKLPNTFPFSGRVIFISNLPKNKIDDAIVSRAYTIDVTLKASDVLARIESIAYDIVPGLPKEVVDDTLKYLKSENITAKTSTFNIRSFIKAVKLRASNSPDWKGLVIRYALS